MTRRDNDPNSPFFTLCQRGDMNKVLEYLRKNPEDLRKAVDSNMRTGLHLAAQEGHISLVEVLLQKGWNINARDRTLKTPLHFACLYGHEVVADVLLKGKSDINAKDSCGRTPLHYAAAGPAVRCCTLCIGTKPEQVNEPDNNKRTPLFYAVWNSAQKQVEIMRTLIENKAEINYQDEGGKTPLHHASEGGRARAIPILL